MDPDREELAELIERSAALRATVARLQSELAAVQLDQTAIDAKLQELGLLDDDLKTNVDRPVADPSIPPSVELVKREHSTLKAAGVGAALTMGVVLIILLSLNLGASRPRASVASSTPLETASASSGSSPIGSASAPASASIADSPAAPGANAPTLSVADLPIVPPSVRPPPALPPIVPSIAPAPASEASSRPAPGGASAAFTATGGLTVVCTPKCDSIVDNNVPLPANNVANVPVASGTHKLVLSAPNGVKKTMLVNITAGQIRELRVSMDKDSPRDYGF